MLGRRQEVKAVHELQISFRNLQELLHSYNLKSILHIGEADYFSHRVVVFGFQSMAQFSKMPLKILFRMHILNQLRIFSKTSLLVNFKPVKDLECLVLRLTHVYALKHIDLHAHTQKSLYDFDVIIMSALHFQPSISNKNYSLLSISL